jgi:hypothetical protein
MVKTATEIISWWDVWNWNKNRKEDDDFVCCHWKLSHTAKIQYRKIETNIPKKGIARLQSKFLHLCFCGRFIFSHNRSVFCCRKIGGPIMEYIYRSQTHECGVEIGTEAAQFLFWENINRISLQCTTYPPGQHFNYDYLPSFSLSLSLCSRALVGLASKLYTV